MNAGRYLAAAAMYRGHVSTLDVDKSVLQIRNTYSRQFVPWMPGNVQSSGKPPPIFGRLTPDPRCASVCSVPPRGLRMSSTFVGNSTSICDVFDRVEAQFATMFAKKAFLHWYTAEGVDEMQFTEAEHNLADLMGEYKQFQADGPSDGQDAAAE